MILSSRKQHSYKSLKSEVKPSKVKNMKAMTKQQLADLAIFSLGIKNNGGAASEDTFSVSKNIKGVKLRARATGELTTTSLNLEATLKKVSATTKKTTPGDAPQP